MALPVFGGVMHGYLTYDMLHFAIHRGTMTSRMGAYLRKHHLQHHYAVPERNFGVSSPLWDFVFRTTR
jgi:sterol desaturase/sphingolipid hydroxylase (fatty acid hydroxylase superfamily)